ncbi:TPA: fimbrial protein [Aeromonas veronii]|nr:fimbrial protein [Aeromonas veronii]
MIWLRNFMIMGLILTSVSARSVPLKSESDINLYVTYMPPTCTITANDDSSQVTIDFGKLARNPDSWARQKIPVKLRCDESIKSVRATVIGKATGTGNLKSEGVDDSVEIGIYMGDERLEVNRSYTLAHHDPLLLEAQPVATGKAIPSEGGQFIAQATLRVDYE